MSNTATESTLRNFRPHRFPAKQLLDAADASRFFVCPTAEQIEAARVDAERAQAINVSARVALDLAEQLHTEANSWKTEMQGFTALVPGRYRWSATGEEFEVTEADAAKHRENHENAMRLDERRRMERLEAAHASLRAAAEARRANEHAKRLERYARIEAKYAARRAPSRCVVRPPQASRGCNARSRRSRVVRAVAGKTTSTGDPDPESEPSPLAREGGAVDSHSTIGGAA